MRDFYKELSGKKVIDADFIEFLELGQIDLSENDKKSIIEKIKTNEFTFAKGLSEELKEVFYKNMPPINKYLEKLTSEGAYSIQAERLLGGEDFNMKEFKEFYEACKLRGYGLEFKKGNSQNNLMQLATFYGRFEVYEFLKEQGMKPLDFITGVDYMIDGQKCYRSYTDKKGVKIFDPLSENSPVGSDHKFIQERLEGVRNILNDIVVSNKDNPEGLNRNFIQNLAAYYELIDVLEELYKIPEVVINPVSARARDSSPAQIFMANDLRKSAPKFIKMLKDLEAQGRVFELDSHSVGFAIINYPEEWDFLFSKFDLKNCDSEAISNFWNGSFAMLLRNENIADKANKTQRIEYVVAILKKYPQILNGYTEYIRENFDNSFDPESNDENKKILNSIFSTFLENIKTTDNEAANNFIDHMISKINLLEIDKNKLLAAAIFHGRADIVDKLIFEHGVKPDGLENTCTDEHGKKRVDSILEKYKNFSSRKNDSYYESHCKASLQILLQHLESKAAKPFESKDAEPFEIGAGTEELKKLISLKNMRSIDITQFLSEQKYEYQYIAIKKLIEQFSEEYQDVDKKKADQLLGHALNNIDGLGQETKNGILKAAIFYGRKDIVEKLIFELGVNPDDLVDNDDKSKSLKTKVIELANKCEDEDKRRAVKHCLRKYKKIEEEAFKLVTQDLEASYLPSAENDPAKPEVAPAEVIKAKFKIEDAQIQNAGFGLKVKAFIKFMTSKLNWNDAKVSAYYEEKIVPELKAEFEKKPVKDLESRSEAAKYLRERVKEKKKEVMKTISSDSPSR